VRRWTTPCVTGEELTLRIARAFRDGRFMRMTRSVSPETGVFVRDNVCNESRKEYVHDTKRVSRVAVGFSALGNAT
jgi:hypothetical protein